jgi:DNA adenine methylase
MTEVQRPILRYHGGKWKLAPWILSHFPAHRVYVEPYGGAGSVLLRKPRAYAEVYNDLDGEIVSLFRVVREQGNELIRLLYLTPFSRQDFLDAWYPSTDPLEQARRTIIRAFMGFGSSAATKERSVNQSSRGGLATTGFRSNSTRPTTIPAHDWANYPACLSAIIERLQGVVIENRDAKKVMAQHDSPETLHYVDPPYVPSTRDQGGDYRHEMNDLDHVALCTFLSDLKGKVVLSGYENDLYNQLLPGWHKVSRKCFADGAKERTEVLWMNFKTVQIQTNLFV